MKGNDFLKQLTILVDMDDTLEDLCTHGYNISMKNTVLS